MTEKAQSNQVAESNRVSDISIPVTMIAYPPPLKTKKEKRKALSWSLPINPEKFRQRYSGNATMRISTT